MTKPHLVLASASIGRKMLLEKLNVPFDIQVSDIDEDAIVDPDPYIMVQIRSDAKAQNVAQNVVGPAENALIIAADTAAILGDQIFGKPRDSKHAFEIIKSLQGKTHILATGMAVMSVNKNWRVARGEGPPSTARSVATTSDRGGTRQDPTVWRNIHSSLSKTHVTIRSMTDSDIERYVDHYDLRRFAAAYALNVAPWDMITKIEGSWTNVIGLPFEELLPILQKQSVI